MGASSLPWWGWLIIAGVLWVGAVLADAYDRWVLRTVMIIGIGVSGAIGVIKFVEWAWNS